MEYYSAVKKNEILPFAMTQMELKSIMLNSIILSKKDKYHMISLMCGIYETKQISKGKEREREIKKQTLNYREQTDGYQNGGRWEDGLTGDRN